MATQVETTISRGRLAWHEGKIRVSSGSSRFVATPPGGPLFEGLEQQHHIAEMQASNATAKTSEYIVNDEL
jgi:hypothetical protein